MDRIFEMFGNMVGAVMTSVGIYLTIRITSKTERKAREDEIKATVQWQTRQEMRIEQIESDSKGQTSIVHAERHTLTDAKLKEHEGKIKELSNDLYDTMRRLEDKIDNYFGKLTRKGNNE